MNLKTCFPAHTSLPRSAISKTMSNQPTSGTTELPWIEPKFIDGGCLCGAVRYHIDFPAGHDFRRCVSFGLLLSLRVREQAMARLINPAAYRRLTSCTCAEGPEQTERLLPVHAVPAEHIVALLPLPPRAADGGNLAPPNSQQRQRG